MGVLLGIFVLIFSCNYVFGHVLSNDEEKTIVWPIQYYFKGETYDFETTLKTPFEIWYNAEYNRARKDYYGGSTKEFYYADEGSLYTVFPKTDSDMQVELGCMTTNLTEQQMNFLPDADYFSFTGQSIILFDKLVDVWISKSDEDGAPLSEELLYVFKTENGVDIPVQYISKYFGPKTGVVLGNVVTNYYSFKDTVSKADLLNEADNCEEPDSKLGTDFKRDIQKLHPDFSGQLEIAFKSYTNHHNKIYQHHERQMRKRIFEMNWRHVQEHNRKNLKFRLEVNAFSDWTANELKRLKGVLGLKQESKEALPFPHTLEEINEIVDQLPQNFDLRLEGVVTAPKSQGGCGSCWAFATVAAVEGALAKVNGDRLLDLSEQSLVDCSWSDGIAGCDGGFLSDVWKYVVQNGIPTEREYGVYLEKNGVCHLSNMTTLYKVNGFAQVTPRNPDALKVALYKYGPVTVTVQATKTMGLYSSGVFYDPVCDPKDPMPDHAVTVVGYGNRDGDDYWIVKNSWGETWGEDGYILISAKNDNCFVLDQAYYAVV